MDESTRLAWSWYLGCAAEHGEAIISGQLRRIVVTQPPGTLKSTTWFVALPAWTWIRFPQVRFLLASHDQNNASRDAGNCRKVLESGWYHSSFDPSWKLLDDQNAKLFYGNTATGYRMAISTGSGTGGKKGHVLMTDDIHDPFTVHSKTQRESDKAWFRQGFIDRVMNFKTSAVAVIGHRLRTDELAAELIAEGWPELRLPEEMEGRLRKTFPVRFEHEGRMTNQDPRAEGDWLRPTRYSETEKEQTIKDSGQLFYRARHQQAPEQREHAMFDPDKVNRVKTWPVGTVAVRYWDTAASTSDTACYSSGVLMGRTPEGRYVVIDRKKGRWSPTDRNKVMRNTGVADMRLPGLLFRKLYWEKGASDSGVERDAALAKFLAGIPCKADPAKGDKVVRAEPFSSQWDAGNVDVVEGDWTHDYLASMAEAPASASLDDMDASSGAFNKLAGTSNVEPATAPEGTTVYDQLPAGTFDNSPKSDPYA